MDRNLRIRMVLEALDKATKPIREIGTSSSRTSKQLRETRERLKDIEKAQADLAGFRSLKSGLRTTDAELTKARDRVKALAREISATEAPSKRLTAEFAKAKREAADLTERHGREAVALQRLRDKLSAAGIATTRMAEAERKLRTDAASTTESIERQESRLEALNKRRSRLSAARQSLTKGQERVSGMLSNGTAAVAAGVGMGAPIVSVAKDAMAIEDVMADVRKVVNFDNQTASIARMRDQIVALSTQMPMTAEGLGQIVAAAGRSGIAEAALAEAIKQNRGAQLSAAQADAVRIKSLTDFATDAAKMAVAFDMSAEDAGTMIATWRTAFNTSEAGVVRLGDQVNALTNAYGGNVSVVNGIITRIGPLGAVAGVASSQIAGLAQMMAKLGLEEDVGATGIKNMMLALSRGAATTPHAAAAFKQLGLDASKVAKDMQRDAGGTILDVFTRLSKLNGADRPGVMTRLFGRESIAAIAPLLTNLDQLRTNFALVGNQAAFAGSMEKEYQSRSATTSNAVLLANNNFTALKITVGTLLLPTIVSLAQKIGTVLQWLRGWARAHPGLAKALAVTVGIVAALTLAFGALMIAAAGLLAPFAALMPVAAGLEIGMLPLIGIILAVVAAGAALAAVAYLIYEHWGAISGFFGRVWDGVKRVFSAALGTLLLMLDPFHAFGSNIVQGIIDGITGKLSALKSTIVNAASAAATWFKEKLGIHSPSRVFHQFGGFLMQGLHNGIDGNAEAPVRRIGRLSKDLATALAVGAATPAIAANSAGEATNGRGGATSPAPIGAISITIHQAPGQSSQDLARAVREEIEKLRRADHSRSRSSYRDDPDHGAFA